jgi:TonB family protein
MTLPNRYLLSFAIFTVSVLGSVIAARAQSCDLRLAGFAMTGDTRTTVRGGDDGSLAGVTITAVLRGRSAAGSRLGNVTEFRNIRAGVYTVTLQKSGYKTSVYSFDHQCDGMEPGQVSSLRLWPGRSSVVAAHPVRWPAPVMRMERLTVVGTTDADVPSQPQPVVVDEGAPLPPVKRVPKTISGGVLNGKATSLPKPKYPPAARAVKAEGMVTVQVTIDEMGKVISATAVSGHPLLREAAVSAAREARFSPTKLSGQPVKVTGIIQYNFVSQ